MDIKRSLSEIKKNWKSLWWWQDRFVQRIIVPLIFRSNNGHYIFDEQWDNLVILDSCRYDTFKEVVEEMKLEGKLESKISRGTNTATFLLENFCDDRYDNIVYITANPYVNKLLKGKFYKIIPVWDKGWDDKLGTVHPEKVYEYTLNALRKYHDKKFIIHFLQPHIPFISYNSFSARAKESVEELRKATIENRNISVKYPKFKPFRLFDEGSEFYLKMPKDKLLQAYKENLKLAMTYVEKLLNFLPGKTVITADHGEAFGEFIHPIIPIRVYGHAFGIRISALTRVPWFISERKEVKFTDLEREIIRIKMRRLREKVK